MNKLMRCWVAVYVYSIAACACANDVESLLSLLANEPVIEAYNSQTSSGTLLKNQSKTTLKRVMNLMQQHSYGKALLKMNVKIGFRSLYFIQHEKLIAQGFKKFPPHCLITLEQDQTKWVIDVNMVELSGVNEPFLGTEAAWLEKLTEISQGKLLRKKSSLVFYRDYSSSDALLAAEAEPLVELVKHSTNWVRKPWWYKIWYAKYQKIDSAGMDFWRRLRTQCHLSS